MKKLIYALMALSASLAVLSCEQQNETPDPELTPKTTTVTVSPEGGDYEILYSLTNPAENVKIAASSPQNWIGGFVYEEGRIGFTVAANPDEEDRSGEISVTYGNLGFKVSVNQARIPLTEPEDAGEIEGNENPATGEEVILSVAEIKGADTYRWMKDGEEVQNTESNTLQIYESGIYTVAGVNSLGEGGTSPEKQVTFDEDRFIFYNSVATYEGGDFNNAYHVTLSSRTGENTEAGVMIIFYHEKPEDPENIILPPMTYKAIQPIDNDYTAVGTVAPNSMWSQAGSYFYESENGVVTIQKYFKEHGGEVTVEKNGDTYTITCSSMGLIDRDENPLGEIEFSWSGELKFKNNWKEYNTYYFEQDNLEEDMDLGALPATSGLYYIGQSEGQGHKWHLELWQDGSTSLPSWDIITEFYTSDDDGYVIPEGTYTIAEDPTVCAPGTADRGYYYNSYLGTKLQYWDGKNYTIHVLAQPNEESYVKVEYNGDDDTFYIEIKIFDSLGNMITANYSGDIPVYNDSGNTSTPTMIPLRYTAR